MNVSFPKSLDTIDAPLNFFTKQVAELTDEAVLQYQLFAAGEVVPGLQALDATTKTPSR